MLKCSKKNSKEYKSPFPIDISWLHSFPRTQSAVVYNVGEMTQIANLDTEQTTEHSIVMMLVKAMLAIIK